MNDIIGVGIETSCDETSVAVVKNGRELLSMVVYSQIEEHAEFRGVVPELASRAHLEKINSVAEEAFRQAAVSFEALSYVSCSASPGLLGSLMIGAIYAKSLSLVFGTPVIAVDHLEAHLHALMLEDRMPSPPFLGILLSGGNSAIFSLKVSDDRLEKSIHKGRASGFAKKGSVNLIRSTPSPFKMDMICDTLDDALGEAFDKCASLLSLPYPGGASLEKLASSYTPQPDEKPLFGKLLKQRDDEILFSFSGIKTAVARAVEHATPPEKIAYYFQHSVFELVERNIIKAVKLTGTPTMIAGGGVVANRTLQKRFDKLAHVESVEILYPSRTVLCTDNGGMVAALGYEYYRQGLFSDIDFPVYSKRYLPCKA